MRELSLHILDIAQNSIRADASCIEITIDENIQDNQLIILIQDNGKGMSEEVVQKVKNPFVTSRTLRKVGLGIPLLYQLCQECQGTLEIDSRIGKGTYIKATMVYDHIDRLPLGKIEKTMTMLILAKPEIHYIYTHIYNKQSFVFDTNEIKNLLQDIPIDNLEIITWIEEFIRQKITDLKKI